MAAQLPTPQLDLISIARNLERNFQGLLQAPQLFRIRLLLATFQLADLGLRETHLLAKFSLRPPACLARA